MRWTWEYLGATRTLHDDSRAVYIPGAGCVQIMVSREVGTGMPPNENETEDKVQTRSGRVWLFNYLEQRILRLTLSIFGKEPNAIGSEDIVTAKRIIAQWFNPQPSAPDGILTFVGADGIVRAINARYDSGLEYDWVYTDQGEFVAQVRLLCPDPLWFDPEENEVTWAQSGATNLVLCYVLPYTLCEGVSAAQAVINAGDWATFPIIEIDGPASDVSVINTTTGESIRATYSIGAGVTATYDLTPGIKTVRDSLGNNLLPDLIQPNDLATFHLASAFEYNDAGVQIAPGGINIVVITSGSAAAVAKMKWVNRYLTN